MSLAPLTEHIPELRLLVTGGSGFLVAHIVTHLLNYRAVAVVVISRKPNPLIADEGLREHLLYYAANVADRKQV